MDLIGHCAVAEMSGVLTEEEVYGPGIVELMFPNYMHCHDWAYGHCWEPEQFGEFESTAMRLRAHIVCDWVIHYGTEHTHIKEKCGWIFQHADIAQRLANEFFSGAAQAGYFEGAMPDPEQWTEKKRLDFSHSFVEYAIDLLLAERTITPARFQAIKTNLSRLSSNKGYGSCSWAVNMFERLGTTSERSPEFIFRSIHQMAQDAEESSSPAEFAIRTASHKYALRIEAKPIRYVRHYLELIAAELDLKEVASLCKQIATIIHEPQTIYSGAWRGNNL